MTVVRDVSTSHDVTTDAAFRAWATMVHNGLVGVGMVETNDTGEIDLTTVSAPSISTFAGYEVFRFNDAGQSDNPIYFKFEYGKGSNTARAAWRVTVGTGTDGAGTIANALTALTGLQTSTPAATPEFHAVHIDGVLMMIDLGLASGGLLSGPFLQIERLRDENGNVIATGGNRGFVVSTGGGAASSQRKGGVNANSTLVGFPLGLGSGPLPDGRKRLSPYCLGDNNPCIGMLMAKSGEVAAGDTGTASPYGTAHTYRVLTAAANAVTGINPYAGSQSIVPLLLNE